MNYTNQRWICRILCFLILSFVVTSCSAKDSRHNVRAQSIPSPLVAKTPLLSGDFLRNLTPTKKQSLTSLDVIDKLRNYHYRQVVLDDRMSSKVLDNYLSELDNTRSYFLSSDVNEFEVYRYRLDDALKAAELEPAFRIFSRYQKRLVERLVFMVNRIEQGLATMDFGIEESIETDRKNAPWPASSEELDELWRKRLKREVLNLKLAGKSLDKIRELLSKRYRSRLNLASQTKSRDAFSIFLNALAGTYDPHTQYFSPRMSENFEISMRLSLEGIGAVLQSKNEYTKVLRLVPAGPADKGKELKPGDLIVGVGQGLNGEIVDVIGWRLDDVVHLIRGPKGTVVRLEVIPSDAVEEHKRKVITITRNTVNLKEQGAEKKVIELTREGRSYKVGVIDIPAFYIDFKAARSGDPNYRKTARDVRRLLKELMEAKVDGIIIDLRDNGGGALHQAIELAGLFIETGPVVQVRKANGQITVEEDKDPEIAYQGPMVVLLNRLSASAAEIFAGAIQDYQRGVLVGARTFGKGTVQALLNLRQGKLKITSAKFYRVSGESTQHKGVDPDITLPAVYNVEKIGESALPNALSWDQIRGARYQPYDNLKPLIPQLRARHEARIKQSPDFAYLTADIKRLREAGKKTKFSLREATLRQERERSDQMRLAMENKRRAAKGLKPLKKISERKEEDEGQRDDKEKSEEGEADLFLTESQSILIDLVTMSKGAFAGN